MGTKSALAGAKHAARLLALCLVASIAATLLVRQGVLNRVEVALADHAAYSIPVAPMNRTLLIATDEETIRKTGKFPLDRALLARVLTRLEEAGVRRVYVDASLNYSEDALVDGALELAIARLGPERIALPRSRLAGKGDTMELTVPLERFSRHAAAVTTEYIHDVDRRIRRIGPLPGRDMPLTVDWLAGRSEGIRKEPLTVNMAVDARRLKHVSVLDIDNGMVRPDAIRGRDAIIGLQVAATQYRLSVPQYANLSRLDFFGIAAETIDHAPTAPQLSNYAAFALTFAIAFVLALAMSSLGSLPALAVCLLFFTGWVSNGDKLQAIAGYALPALGPPLAALIVGQTLKFRDSPLARWFGRIWVRFAGIGKNSLVAAMDVMSDPALIYDAEGAILGMNEAFDAFRSGLPDRGHSRTARIADLFPDIASDLLANVGDSHAKRHDLAVKNAAGETRHFEIGVRWVETMSGRLAIAGIKDVTEARERETSLARLAFKDNLTGLANRMSFTARLTRHSEENSDYAVLMIDLDGFKQVNDTLGHHAGDELLIGVARRLEKLLRPSDLAARFGGDEFAVLLASGSEAGAALVATRLLQSLQEPFDVDSARARVGASIGIALGPAHHSDPLEVLKLADAAMYAAKKVKPAFAVHRPDTGATVTRVAA